MLIYIMKLIYKTLLYAYLYIMYMIFKAVHLISYAWYTRQRNRYHVIDIQNLKINIWTVHCRRNDGIVQQHSYQADMDAVVYWYIRRQMIYQCIDIIKYHIRIEWYINRILRMIYSRRRTIYVKSWSIAPDIYFWKFLIYYY